MQDNKKKQLFLFYFIGLFFVLWFALLIAPISNESLANIIIKFPEIIDEPFKISWCENSIKIILLFAFIYSVVIFMYLSSEKNYRRREEHGSAKWGIVKEINKKYQQQPNNMNKILTKNFNLGLNGKLHRRNLNILVCGGSGAGKTRFFAKPNIMQCNTSFVILDPNGKKVLL